MTKKEFSQAHCDRIVDTARKRYVTDLKRIDEISTDLNDNNYRVWQSIEKLEKLRTHVNSAKAALNRIAEFG